MGGGEDLFSSCFAYQSYSFGVADAVGVVYDFSSIGRVGTSCEDAASYAVDPS